MLDGHGGSIMHPAFVYMEASIKKKSLQITFTTKTSPK